MFYLQLRNELWKLFGKKRTYIGFGMFLAAQLIICVLFRYTTATSHLRRMLTGNGYGLDFISALTIAVIMMVLIAIFLLPLYAALVGGDLVAKEAEDGTLRMILCRPVGRLRLLTVKWLAGLIFSFLLVATLGLFGAGFAGIWFPWSGLFVWFPEQGIFSLFDATTGGQRYLLAHLFLVAEAVTVMGVAFMFSCFNIKPAAATILALSFVFVNFILQQIPYFKDYQTWIVTYHLNLWQFIFDENIPWWKVWQSLSILVGFNASFFVIGASAFQLRDIKS
jgi:ABC-2 type transport system permease protein